MGGGGGERDWENFCEQKFSQTFQKTLSVALAANGERHKKLIQKQPKINTVFSVKVF